MFKKLLLGLVLVIGAFLLYAATRPDTYRVERAAKIDAPIAVVYSQLEDFKAWGNWSPWEKLDPAMKKSYQGPPKGPGAMYSWEGNKKVGKGKMTIKDARPPTFIEYELAFVEPFAAVSTTTFNLTPDGDKATNVTWAMEGKNNLIGKAWGVFMNMDQAIGGDFEKGLAGLETVSESEAKKQAEVAVLAAKAEAEAAAAAAAKAQAEAAAAEAAAAAAAEKKPGKRPARR
jgi:uncharacterized protein YndB with AHSA1/START domain